LVIAAFDGAGADGPRTDVIAALERHETILIAHLALEEELVIPRLLALTPSEFDDFVSGRSR
jgi:hypothetical protein